jgi:S-adenosylmethionine:tRNA ribosyltransferase-isomerase
MLVPMRTADFDYELPPELIAQRPAPRRDASRLLVLDRKGGKLRHRRFTDLPSYLRKGDLLVLNNSKVIPARLRGANARSGGRFEILLLSENARNDWWCMLRPGKRARVGTRIVIHGRGNSPTGVVADVNATNAEGHRRLVFTGASNLLDVLERHGEAPLPPYINRGSGGEMADDFERYQTVYASVPGSVAAPTAGLHFTDAVFEELSARGVGVGYVTLHVGLGTFAPVKAEMISGHIMHEERFELDQATVRQIEAARAGGGRVVAVGTTTVRVLESVAAENGGQLASGTGATRIFIHPPRDFAVVDALVTNFHLPRSTLLMLVSAFATPGGIRGRELVLAAYAEAIRERYRFFSYGDAMLIF